MNSLRSFIIFAGGLAAVLSGGLICGCGLLGLLPGTNAPPAAVAGDNRQAEVGETVRFDAGESFDPDGTIVAFNWDFGDGAGSDQAVVEHVYSEAGEFTVFLTVTDDRGATGTDSFVVTVVEPPVFTVQVAVTPFGAGMIELDPPGGSYLRGTEVSIMAVPAEDFDFAAFQDADGQTVSTEPELVVVVTDDIFLTALFEPAQEEMFALTVIVSPADGGTVTLDPPGGSYVAGTTVLLTSQPAAGFEFVRFSGDIDSSSPTTAIEVISDMTIVAEFAAIPTFTLTVTVVPEDAGSVSLDPPGGMYLSGTSVTLTAVPWPCCPFLRYSGDLVSTNATAAITMDADKSVQAEFDWTPQCGAPGNLLVSGLVANNVSEFDRFSGGFLCEIVPGESDMLNGGGGIQFGPESDFFVVSILPVESGDLFSSIIRFDGITGESKGTFVRGDSGVLFVTFTFGPDGALFAPDGDAILRYSGTDGQLIGTFVVSGDGGLNNPRGLTFGPEGNFFVVSQGTNSVLEYDGVTGAFVRAYADLGAAGLENPVDLVFGSGDDLFVTISGDNSVARVHGDTRQIEVFVASGSGGLSFPAGLRFHPDSGHLLVASQETDTVLEYDGSTGEFRRVFAEGSGSDNLFFMAFRP